MEKRKLNEFVTFVPGINPTRAQKQFETQKINYYDQASFEADYNREDVAVEEEAKPLFQNNLSLNEGDVVISNSLQLATIVGKNNVGKVLSLNFTKIEFDIERLDEGYFLYLFNAYKDVKRQKERELQGSGPILRIPLRALGEIIIPVAPIEEQKKIGAIYVETLKLQNKLNIYADLIEQFSSSIIEETLKGK
ncbi:restriction endonuclease subunit S [Bacillus subtilis]|uniref:Restriction endonuclease subunit S n=1 Tax=Bacillus tequilensis TaxID=227866 RepID=A0A6H0WM71_9BACI|nr:MULTISPECIES: restriction endonuclease subunit S [Bacillus subtilis group]MED1809010.1 restriction endonuclease subunit S [Bacillus subtilis]AZV50175.1 restriction endonuclease subunit S [Bacillus halotolerans]MCY8309410.1 restriction endonuclease subunit S [Bacillus vallismortis]MCY8598590.1 restriction endonuclease subunit S [Bacillus vallismortis]QIW81308.1 restriction endonuclease subunit S [Bacillus tequilensis]